METNTEILLKINTDPLLRDEFKDIQRFTKCIFCEPPKKKILVETKSFYVTYDACALLDGHAEIHTKEHIGCSAEVSEEIFDEFVNLKAWLGKLVSDIYGDVSFYEHGRAGHCSMTLMELFAIIFTCTHCRLLTISQAGLQAISQSRLLLRMNTKY